MQIMPMTKIRTDRLAAFKSGTDRKRCTVVWPTPELAFHKTERPIAVVQNEVRTNGLGSMLNYKKYNYLHSFIASHQVDEIKGKLILEYN